MKKIIISFLVGLMLIPAQAFAAFQAPPGEAYLAAYYNSWKDEYRAVYSKMMTGSFDTVRVYFETVSGSPFQVEYAASVMANASAYWLTCNGFYQFQYLRNGQIVYYSDIVETTAIVAPTCASYPNGGGSANDANADYSYNPSGGGSYDVNWSDIPGSDSYEVYVDGVLVDTIPADVSGEYTTNIPLPGGGVSIVGKDSNGDVTGHSDINVPEDLYEPESSSECDVCQQIRDALNCPEWDLYMGELTGAIEAALPTLPEWRDIADQFVDAFGEYFGEVPTTAPNPTNITPEIPAIDTSVPDADFDLVVPTEFDQPFVFDITSATPIPVIDESEPFTILEPDANIDADDPGVFVFPGDERNSSDGIKQPDTVTTGYPMPEPTAPPSPSPTPSIPPSEMPVPSGTTGTTPEPGETGGDVPIPSTTP